MRPASNPVISGCYPDPSICRVGGDYFLVTSSFGYFPGLPVFHSRDLVNWEVIGHGIDRPSQLPLEGYRLSDGVWAATIRFHDGTYYIVFTLSRHGRSSEILLITASDPRGPWSDPVRLDAEGIDPDLFFDTDGRCWVTASRNSQQAGATGPGEIWTRELDLDALQTVGQVHVLWHGALAGVWVEAPHIYLHDGSYHLLAAEGGTERNHAVTAARSDRVTGPYRTDPRSPLLTHRDLPPEAPIQNVGHADLVEDTRGDWWAVVLGVRPVDGFHTLGREVFLTPVEWRSTGLVMAAPSGRVEESLPLPARQVEDAEDVDADEFEQGRLGAHWVGLRSDVRERIADSAGRGGILLGQSHDILSELAVPSYLGRRLDSLHFTAATELSLAGRGRNQHGGLALLYDEANFSTLMLGVDDREWTFIEWRVVLDGQPVEEVRVAWPETDAALTISGDRDSYTFLFGTENGMQQIGSLPRAALSTERAGGFVGTQIGIYTYAHADERAGAAHFRMFQYSRRSVSDLLEAHSEALTGS